MSEVNPKLKWCRELPVIEVGGKLYAPVEPLPRQPGWRRIQAVSLQGVDRYGAELHHPRRAYVSHLDGRYGHVLTSDGSFAQCLIRWVMVRIDLTAAPRVTSLVQA
jgi:hypothetical protein